MTGKGHKRDGEGNAFKSNARNRYDVQRGVIRHSSVVRTAIGIQKLKPELKNYLSSENSRRQKVK